MTSLVDKQELKGNALVYLPRYVTPNDELFEKSDAEIEHEFLAGLQRMHPSLSLADVKAFRVSRVRHVFALSTLGYSDRLPPTVTSVPGLYSLNSAHIVNGTLNVNETIKLANDFAARLPEILTKSRASARTEDAPEIGTASALREVAISSAT
jgi:protoporphyrinogen oxidase